MIDTVRIARLALHRDEVRNCKLATLSSFFRTEVQPTHRAFDDARATTDVMHHLFERLGNYGVHTLEDLHAFTSRVSDVQRNKKNLADGLPGQAGCLHFRRPTGTSALHWNVKKHSKSSTHIFHRGRKPTTHVRNDQDRPTGTTHRLFNHSRGKDPRVASHRK